MWYLFTGAMTGAALVLIVSNHREDQNQIRYQVTCTKKVDKYAAPY